MISKIRMTTARAEYSSVLSMPLNTLLLSAAVPSGPVICETRPFAFELMIARMASAALLAPAQPCVPRSTLRMVSRAWPSVDGIGPITVPGTTWGSRANRRASAAALARSAAVRPEGRR